MRIKITFLFLSLIIASCADTETKNELKKVSAELKELKNELANCSADLTKIQNTPEQRNIRAQKYLAENNLAKAKSEFQGIVKNFKGTKDADLAENEITKIDKKVAKEKAEQERKKALGYKILKQNSRPKYGELTLRFDKIWKGKRWSFNDYGSQYFLRDAKRGNKHILARVSITSENNNPKLPPVSVYKMTDGELKLLGTLGYEFRRWKDYGSYLGNYADYGNDFSHSKTIPFNLGLELSEDQLKSNTIYIVMKNQGCFTREKKDYGSPEISYNKGYCSMKETLTVEDFDSDYVLLKKL